MAALTEARGGGVIPLYLRIAPQDIAYVKFLIESYEEIGLVRTVDRHKAVIVFLIAEDFQADARAVVDEVLRTIECAVLPDAPADPDDWLMKEL